ncbi:MAG: hypothetical protein HWN66_18905 [Candidatus Helarchaeota archaeon]|nr:hypothetical protein [Candidatus Helarchaeota archaeon]
MTHNKTAIWTLVVVILIFRLSTDLFSQELPKFSARVKVDVTADENISSRIESYIKRELRSLQDITIVEDNANFRLSVIALELKTISGEKTGGIALSTVILSPVDVSLMVNLLKVYDVIYPEKIVQAEEMIGTWEPCRFLDFSLQTGSAKDLKRLCEGVVADFDSEFLEIGRKTYQELKDKLEKSRQKEKK